jgi:hypothetical protein
MATGYYLLDNRTKIPQCGRTRRNGAKASGTIILHDAEGGTDLSGADMGAENVANFIKGRDSYGSYHDLVDRDTHIPMAPIDYETWHSVPDNPWSFGICVAWTKADLPKMTYEQRRSYYVPLARVVLKRVADFARRGITVPTHRMLTAAETQARKPGISTHSRTDPSRRSDPFGTGSKYETEFLAVLAELRDNKTPQQEEPDMDATQAKQLSDIHNVLMRKLPDGSGATTPDQIWARNLDVSRRTLAAVIAEQAAPATAEVDVDASAVADALLERLSPSIAQDVANALATRLAQ